MLLFDDNSISKKKHKIFNVGNNSIEEIIPEPKEELNYADNTKNTKDHQIISLNAYHQNGVIVGDKYEESFIINPTPLSDELPPYTDEDKGKEHKVIGVPIISSGYVIGKEGLTISGIIKGTPQNDEVYSGVISEASYDDKENDYNRSLSQVYIDRTDNLDDHDINLDNVIF